jgi:UTP--glucose-1-phosphate uridylyltransferase
MTPQPIKKAVIAVAGYGTRMLPATKAIPKEMLTVFTKPAIQLIVEELVDSGITQIIMVTQSWKHAIEDHFDRNPDLESTLAKQEKNETLKHITQLNTLAEFFYIQQKPDYGTAIPLFTARHLVENEPFVYVFADDLVKSKTPFTKHLIDTYAATGATVLGVQEVAPADISRYGIVETQPLDKILQVTDMVEKPEPGETSSSLASFGRFVLTPSIWSELDKITTGKNNEYYLTDALRLLLKKERIVAQKVEDGSWLTTGDPLNFLKANLTYALDDPILGESVRETVAKLLK